MSTIKLYHHKTDGGAEYLTDKCIVCPNGEKEGIFAGAKYIVRIDGDITQDAELSVDDELFTKLLAACQALPIGKADWTDAADFKDYASEFLEAMKLAEAAIAKATKA